MPVRVITAEEAAAGSVSIFDVVLPLPGDKIEYPQNDSRNDYFRELASAGLGWHSFDRSKQGQPEVRP